MLYAIGDIHGETVHLRRLLWRIREHAAAVGVNRPRLVFLGDYGDRGPDSRGVYDLLSSPALNAEFDVICLKGNHEEMLLTAEAEPAMTQCWLSSGGDNFVRSYGIDADDEPAAVQRKFFGVFPDEHRQWLAGMALRHAEAGYVFVHAGIDPLDPQGVDPDALLWIREPFLSGSLDYGFTVVHGHSRSPSVAVTGNRIGVDTGCGCWPTGLLSAVVLPGDGAPPVTVLTSHRA